VTITVASGSTDRMRVNVNVCAKDFSVHNYGASS
jgi:hypothetical protein